MRALITGASSGIGRDMAIILSRMGYDLVLVARSRSDLEALRQELPTAVEICALDLSKAESCYLLYEQIRPAGIDILINNAGFGCYGEFAAADLETELNMIDLNIRAVHILTKLFLRDFIKADRGAILNVASIGAFLPGPLLAGYYASKAYVLRMTEAIHEELRRRGSSVKISVLCPGPVKTGFNKRAGAAYRFNGMSSADVAAYALKKMARGKMIIIPGWTIKALRLFSRFAGDRLLLAVAYKIQKMKGNPAA